MKCNRSRSKFGRYINLLKLIVILAFLTWNVSAQNLLTDGLNDATAATTATKPSPTKPDLYDKSIDPYSGSLKLSVPLLNLPGRGSTAINMSLIIQTQNISGVGTYPTTVLSDPASPTIFQLFESPTPRKAYFERLVRFGSLYGPGVVYANWQSYNFPVNAQGQNVNWNGLGRRPGHLTFIDSSGRQISLRDQQLVREARYCLNGNGTYLGNAFQYHDINSAGRVYRSVEDNGTVFFADGILSVPTQSGNLDEWYNAQDVPLLPTGYLYLRDGTRMRIVSGYISWARDRNGNTVFYDYESVPGSPSGTPVLLRTTHIQDSLNREVFIQYGSYSEPDVITFTGVGNIPRSVKVQRKLLENALQTGDTAKLLRDLYPGEHWQLNLGTSQPGAKYNPEIISSVEFSDGRSLSFEYDSYGEVVWTRKPEGSATRFKYSAGAKNSDVGGAENQQFPYTETDSDGNVHGYVRDTWLYYRRLTEVTEFIDSATVSQKTTISRPEAPENTNPPGSVKVNVYDAVGDLLGSSLHYYFNLYKRQHFLSDRTPCSTLARWNSGVEYKTETFNIVDHAPVLAKTEEKTWTHGPFNVTPGIGDYSWWDGNVDNIWLPDRPRIVTERTTLSESNLVLIKTYQYDQYLNQTDVNEYDYGPADLNNGQGPLLRRVHTDYVDNLNGVSYPGTGLYMSSLPLTRLTYNGSDPTPVSRIDYEYDNYLSDGGHAPLAVESNIIKNCIHYNDARQCTVSSDGNFIFRGNVTSVTTYLNPINLSGAVKTYTRYDVAGNTVGTTDALGNVSTSEFTDSYSDGLNRYTYAFASSVTSPIPDSSGIKGSSVAFISRSVRDYGSGLVVTSTDINNQTTTNIYAGPDGTVDPLNRLRKVLNSDGGWTTFEYSDTPGNIYVHTQTLWQSIPTQRTLDSYEYFDNYRRTIRTFTFDGSAPERNWTVTDTKYDALGRKVRVSNPYFTASPGGPVEPGRPGTVTEYDGLGRVRTVTTADSARVVTAYYGVRVMATDQAHRSRRTDFDGIGRLVKVVEYDRVLQNFNVIEEPASGDYVTTYQYDAQDNLTKVVQANQTREFTYDAFKRLIAATNPENGTCLFEYDNNSNLRSRTDARSVKSSYTYDSLNRVLQRTYSVVGNPASYIPSPQVDFFYDGKGMPSGVSDPQFARGQISAIKTSVAETISTEFDGMGRVTSQMQVVDPSSTTDRAIYSTSYSYNLGGSLTSETYPSGKVVATEYDAAGRVAGIRRQDSENYYVGGGTDGIRYTSFGAIQAIKLGNGLWEHRDFNVRQQTTQIALGTSPSNSSVLNLDYKYGLLVSGSLDQTLNNGNPQSQTISALGSSFTQIYEYDPLNRLHKALEFDGSTPNWSQVFKYDAFGNRNFDTGGSLNQSITPVNDPIIDPNTNRIDATAVGQSNIRYDGAGNLTRDVVGSNYSYDSENRQVLYKDGNLADGGATYSYDGNGRRIKKVTANGTTVFVYDVLGQQIAEYTNESPQNSNGINYITTDVLGSTRVVTNSHGIASRHDYKPYGEEIVRSGYGGTDTVRQKFTGQVRDAETSLDFFQARYYSADTGRFTSPDEFDGGAVESFTAAASSNPTLYADPIDPQTFNKYQYALNNPLRYVDPSGHFGVDQFWAALDSMVKKGVDAANALGRAATNIDPLDSANMQRAQLALDQYPEGKPNRVYGFTGPDVNTILQAWTDAKTNAFFVAAVGFGAQDIVLGLTPLFSGSATVTTNFGVALPRITRVAPPPVQEVETPRTPATNSLPEMEFSSSKNPQLAENISQAQMAGHPDVLTYGGSNRATRTAALRGVPGINGLSRDEYPFASTLEGGSGAWVGHIPPRQNWSQGGIMNSFYQKNKIQKGDRFRVVVRK